MGALKPFDPSELLDFVADFEGTPIRVAVGPDDQFPWLFVEDLIGIVFPKSRKPDLSGIDPRDVMTLKPQTDTLLLAEGTAILGQTVYNTICLRSRCRPAKRFARWYLFNLAPFVIRGDWKKAVANKLYREKSVMELATDMAAKHPLVLEELVRLYRNTDPTMRYKLFAYDDLEGERYLVMAQAMMFARSAMFQGLKDPTGIRLYVARRMDGDDRTSFEAALACSDAVDAALAKPEPPTKDEIDDLITKYLVCNVEDEWGRAYQPIKLESIEGDLLAASRTVIDSTARQAGEKTDL